MTNAELLVELAELGLKRWDPAREKSQRSVSGAEKLRIYVASASSAKRSVNHAANQAAKRAAKRTVKQAVGYEAQIMQENMERSTCPHVRQAAKWATKRSRYIPTAIRREVWRRDGGQCTYMGPITKNKCDSRHLLQIDHSHPYSIGGAHEVQNLRLLCAAHNQYDHHGLHYNLDTTLKIRPRLF